MKSLLFIAGSFVIGSIPTGQFIARVKGMDLKKSGSGNIGATNVLRTMGKIPALLTLLGDLMKGVIMAGAAKYLFPTAPVLEGIMGLAAILGHIFSVFLGFRGGKGVATSIGVLLVYMPQAALITILIWLTVAFITRYSSLGAILSFCLLPVNVYLFESDKVKLIISVLITAAIMFRHISNIRKLIEGTESRIGKKTDIRPTG